MLRYDFYYKQYVSQQELDDAFDGTENAIFQVSSDIKENGVFSGLDINPTTPDSTSVTVDPGVGKIESTGERISKTTATETVDASLDWNGQPTFSDLGAGEGRWCSIFVKFKRALSYSRTDGHGNPILYIKSESYEFEIYRATKGLAVNKDTLGKPGLLTTHILLADIWFENGSTNISSADLDVTRRQDFYRQLINSNYIVAGSPKEALTELGTLIDTAVMTDRPDWYGAVALGTISALWDDTVNGAINAIVKDLANKVGAKYIGSEAYISGSTYDLAIDDNIQTHLKECIDNLNDHVTTAGHPATTISVADTTNKYADGTSLGADVLQNIFENLADFIGTKTTVHNAMAGTKKIGTNKVEETYNGLTLTANGNVSLDTQLSSILMFITKCIQVTGDNRIEGDLIPEPGLTIKLGSAADRFDSVYADNLISDEKTLHKYISPIVGFSKDGNWKPNTANGSYFKDELQSTVNPSFLFIPLDFLKPGMKLVDVSIRWKTPTGSVLYAQINYKPALASTLTSWNMMSTSTVTEHTSVSTGTEITVPAGNYFYILVKAGSTSDVIYGIDVKYKQSNWLV